MNANLNAPFANCHFGTLGKIPSVAPPKFLNARTQIGYIKAIQNKICIKFKYLQFYAKKKVVEYIYIYIYDTFCHTTFTQCCTLFLLVFVFPGN